MDLAFALRMSTTVTGIPAVRADRFARRKWLAGSAVLAEAAAMGGSGYWAGRRRAATPAPTYRKLTFRDGWITRACFANDASVVYVAKWGDGPFKLYHQPVNDQIAREIDVPDLSNLAVVSLNNDVALILARSRTLALLPLAGGAPASLPITSSPRTGLRTVRRWRYLAGNIPRCVFAERLSVWRSGRLQRRLHPRGSSGHARPLGEGDGPHRLSGAVAIQTEDLLEGR